jgi:hypothetical protein
MNDEDIRKIIDDTGSYDEAKEGSFAELLQMAGDFYSRRMLSTAIVVWVNGLIAMAISVVSAVLFFRTDQVKQEIMYLAIFLVGFGWLGFAKFVALFALHRNSISREIKRLEIRLSNAGDARRQQPKP